MAVRITAEAFELMQTMNTQLGPLRTSVDTMLNDGTTLDESADWAGGDNRNHTAEWNEKVRPYCEPLPDEMAAVHTAVQTTLEALEEKLGGF
jgi:hypothetical protein